jgi:hypothetical protein
MSFHRAFVSACVAFLALGTMSTGAFAGCDGCGIEGSPRPVYPVPRAHAPAPLPPPATPVALAPAPLAADHWDTNGFGGCRGGAFRGWGPFDACGSVPACGNCRAAVAFAPAPMPIYLVDQGPHYSGPGFMVLFKTYSPATGLAVPGEFPFISAGHRAGGRF